MRSIDPREEMDAADDGDWIAWDWFAERFGTTPSGLTVAQRRAVVVTMRNMVRYALWRDGMCPATKADGLGAWADGSPILLTEDRP